MSIEHPKHDILIVHGKNWKRRGFLHRSVELSDASKINALAGLRAYNIGLAPLILFSTGQTAGPTNPSEAEAMASYVTSSPYTLSSSAYILQKESFDTRTEIIENKKIIEKRKAQSVGVVSVAVHLPRVKSLYAAYDVEVTGYESEPLARELDPALVERFEQSFLHTLLKIEERLLRAEQQFDPQGKMISLIAKPLRRG